MRNNLIVGTPIEGLHLSLNRLQALTTLVDRLRAERSLKREPVTLEVVSWPTTQTIIYIYISTSQEQRNVAQRCANFSPPRRPVGRDNHRQGQFLSFLSDKNPPLSFHRLQETSPPEMQSILPKALDIQQLKPFWKQNTPQQCLKKISLQGLSSAECCMLIGQDIARPPGLIDSPVHCSDVRQLYPC